MLQAPPITNDDLYLVMQGWDGVNNVLILDQASGKVSQRFEVGYDVAVKLTTNKHLLYVYSHFFNEDREGGLVSAVDTSTSTTLWQINIPGGIPFVSTPEMGAWLSVDEKFLYLQGSPDNLHPHIFVVDTQTERLVNDLELSLPYPSNVNQAFPLIWKLPWAETLVVVSRDQLFTFDLSSGQTGNSIQLFEAESVKRVPLNLLHTAFVWSGTLDQDGRQLFLTTSTQEIFAVDLNTPPFTFKRIATLPTGWQFAVMQPFLLHPPSKTVYVQVKREDTPIIDGLEAEEVWAYDPTSWLRKSSLSLREQMAKSPKPGKDGPDLTNYGLTLSADGQHVYSLNSRGVLQLNQDDKGKLNGVWLNVEGLDPEFAMISVVP